jgi:hypothetical protein
MVVIRSANEIILNLIDYYRLAQPNLDIKPGTVARDLFIDLPASQLALLYDELSGISNKQSLRLVVGNELDQLAQNFGIVRRVSTKSSGVALLTFLSMNAPINITKGSTIIANNGFSYEILTDTAISPLSSNFYRSIATKYRSELDLLGISDEYAVEVTVVASTAGSNGNIGSYSLDRTNISGISNVTNINPFVGGTDQESDAAFRTRTLSSFSGSSVGTELGYLNAALSTTGVVDAVVITPGDSLMTRDGTEVKVNSDGSRTIISEGSGGKVDVVVLGSSLIENTESFIYQDKSNNNDPTSSKNNLVLGQIVGDENKTINKKRSDNIKNGVLPKQPIDSILQIAGSISGSNFKEKVVDSYGRVSGNYELIRDTGVYGGTPWGFDTFHWISNKISLFQEDRIKDQFNGQDNISFSGVLSIPKIQQFISINNENSIVTYDRSIIQLLHTPTANVTRVFNVKTGERYIIADQNPDATGTYNETGRIKISGNTLPSPSDILQVDYSWIITYDQYSDYDGLQATSNPRPVTDSTDWGYASIIKNEKIWFEKHIDNDYFTGSSSHPISSIISAKTFLEKDGTVERLTTGVFVNRLAVIIKNLSNITSSIDSITVKNGNTELYLTPQNNGTFTNENVVVGINILHNTTVILPTDSPVNVGDVVTVYMDSKDIFSSISTNGSFNNNQITIPSSLINTTYNNLVLQVTYIALVLDLFSSAITSLPASKSGNGYNILDNIGFNNQSPVNISRRENQTVQQNLSNEYYLQLNVSNVDYSLLENQIISIVRISDGKELWNSDHVGVVITDTYGAYQVILTGFNSPNIGDKCFIIYNITDNKRFQPYSYSNNIIKTRIDSLAIDPSSGKFVVKINNFTNQLSGLKFLVTEPNTDGYLFSVTDGYLIDNSNSAIISSLTVDFSTLPDLTSKKIEIFEATNSNNNGTYDIISYDLLTNTMVISNIVNKITSDQISIIRLSDSQEIWNKTGTIDVANNKIYLPTNSNIHLNDKVFVMFFNFSNLRMAPTRLSCSIADQSINTGVISINATTLNKVEDVIFTATSTGLKQNLSEAVKKALKLNSTSNIPSTIKLAKLIKLEKVITVSSSSEEVLSVQTLYDTNNTTIQNNILYASEMLADPTLQNLEFILPSTQNNIINLETKNLPTLGDKLRVTFYYLTENDIENLSYTNNGTLYTNKKFVFINRIFITSGFRTSQSAKFTITSFTQPLIGSRYKIFYDYLAPKQNERISLRYNYNQLISDTTFSIENSRPINADVLARLAKLVLLDLTINVVISNDYKSSQTTVLQNLRNQLTSALTSITLGYVVDAPTLINVAQGVAGIARARILHFNKAGQTGQVLIIQAQKDEYFAPNIININTETR